jgi:hypothetical protein
MTDGGMGVMLRNPFSETRQFLPWRPFHTPPVFLGKLSPQRMKMMIASEWPLILCSITGAGVFVMIKKRRLVGS